MAVRTCTLVAHTEGRACHQDTSAVAWQKGYSTQPAALAEWEVVAAGWGTVHHTLLHSYLHRGENSMQQLAGWGFAV